MEPIEQQVLERVAGVAGLSVLLLFGSRGRMDSRPDSDLDVAVLGTAEAAGGLARHRLHKSLSVALADLAPEGRVDVVFLDEAPDTPAPTDHGAGSHDPVPRSCRLARGERHLAVSLVSLMGESCNSLSEELGVLARLAA